MLPTSQCTTQSAAQRLKVDRTTIIRLVKSGDLVPLAKLPGRTGAFLFNAEDVEALAAQRDSAVAR